MRLLQMSLSAGLLIAAIWVLRSFGRRLLSARFLFLLWFVAVARLLVPFDVPVRLPVFFQESNLDHGRTERDGVLYRTGFKKGEEPGEYRGGLRASYARLVFLIWADTALVLLLVSAYTYIRQYMRLRESIPLRGHAYMEEWRASHPMKRKVEFMYYDRVASPVTYGIWNPRIVFPKDMAFEDTVSMGHILSHEYVHIRRFDNLWKITALAAVCVHWFNPLAWVMWRCFNRDMELSCDEGAVAEMDEKGRLSYAMTLLRFAEKNHRNQLLYNGFGKSAVKERIIMLMKNRKRKRLGAVCSIMVLALSMTVFASPKDTSPSQAYDGEGRSPALILSQTPQFGEYEAMGLYYDPVIDAVSYDSRILGYFIDEYTQGKCNKMEDLAGNLCLKAERDENGKLTGFLETAQPEYLVQAADQERRMARERAYIREYGTYGLTYDQDTGYLSYGGRLVEAIRDSGGCGIYVNGAFRVSDDTTCLQVVRGEDGAVQAVEEVTPEQMSKLLRQTIGVYQDGDNWKGEGRTYPQGNT